MTAKTNAKKAKPVRKGDLIRTMWKLHERTRGRCRQCEWCCNGIPMIYALRAARKHTRMYGHITRIAFIEIIEYAPCAGNPPAL